VCGNSLVSLQKECPKTRYFCIVQVMVIFASVPSLRYHHFNNNFPLFSQLQKNFCLKSPHTSPRSLSRVVMNAGAGAQGGAHPGGAGALDDFQTTHLGAALHEDRSRHLNGDTGCKPGDWVCPGPCFHRNWRRNKICALCWGQPGSVFNGDTRTVARVFDGALSPTLPPHPAIYFQGDLRGPGGCGVAKCGDWVCGGCTQLNYNVDEDGNATFQCFMCQRTKAASGHLVDFFGSVTGMGVRHGNPPLSQVVGGAGNRV
jgi:hypothetical protein